MPCKYASEQLIHVGYEVTGQGMVDTIYVTLPTGISTSTSESVYMNELTRDRCLELEDELRMRVNRLCKRPICNITGKPVEIALAYKPSENRLYAGWVCRECKPLGGRAMAILEQEAHPERAQKLLPAKMEAIDKAWYEGSTRSPEEAKKDERHSGGRVLPVNWSNVSTSDNTLFGPSPLESISGTDNLTKKLFKKIGE